MIKEYKNLDGTIGKIENLKPNFKSVVLEMVGRIENANCKFLELKIRKDIAIRSNECTRYFFCFCFEVKADFISLSSPAIGNV